MTIQTIILAAGQGSRMRSALPKVLHKIADKPLLKHVYDTAISLPNNQITIVYGHGGEQVQQALSGITAIWVEQKQQLGTGHAVQQTVENIADDSKVLILYGDVPLIAAQTITHLLDQVSVDSMALLTVTLADPTGYGRIVRDHDNQVTRIVEHKDASKEELSITECNTGILACQGSKLKAWLSRLTNNNVQNEFYLTDIIQMAVNDGYKVVTATVTDENEVLGVNTRKQLAHLERVYQYQQADALMLHGVTLLDPARVDVRGSFTAIGQDIEVDVNVQFIGNNRIGSNVKIGANCIIKNADIADNVEILPFSLIEDASIGQNSRIGPFARLRPETELADNVHIGNFVEIKKSTIATGSKVNHLSYIGDSEVGSHVNIGAGTITCNYDGANKFKTIIGDGAFIGSDSQLVAPVTIGKNATIGAGSTITKDTPDNQLTLSRVKQVSVENWQRPVKKG